MPKGVIRCYSQIPFDETWVNVFDPVTSQLSCLQLGLEPLLHAEVEPSLSKQFPIGTHVQPLTPLHAPEEVCAEHVSVLPPVFTFKEASSLTQRTDSFVVSFDAPPCTRVGFSSVVYT